MARVYLHNANELPFRSIREELLNSLIHGIGLALSIVGLCILLMIASDRGTSWHLVSCGIFSSALVMLYLSSTLYHGFQSGLAKKAFRKLDHFSIYILIAGSYTPFALTILKDNYGLYLFYTQWGLAFIGIMFKFFFGYRYDFPCTIAYAIMGWAALFLIKPLMEGLPGFGFLWLLTGGLLYTFGIPFYFKDKKAPYFHAIWHIFVLLGSACHFFAVLFYVIPTS
ncbi:MAG: hemolysin III family protein [Pseudomonadota bacterium]